MKVFIKGLNSCGMRKINLQQYRDYVVANGHLLVNNPDDSDVILIWTCAFRKDFRDNSLNEIKRYKNNYDKEIIVAGCLPDIDKDALSRYFQGTIINWRDHDKKMKDYFGAKNKALSEIPFMVSEDKLCDDVAVFKNNNPNKDASFVDQFIKLFIAEGCRLKCAYCTERLTFPPYRSFPENEVIERCRYLVNKTGYKEIMLIGDSIGDYGYELGSDLPALIYRILDIRSDLKISLQGLNPVHFLRFYDRFSELIRNENIRHIQIPIQSASDRILALMDRPYTRMDIEKIFKFFTEFNFRQYDTHLIIGFPGETEEEYKQTIDFILKYHPNYVLLSSYMESSILPAALVSYKLDENIKKRRLNNAESRIKSAGIICNADNGELSKDRFRRLNLINNQKGAGE